ncbi:hypothetical protein [Halovivax gelatinilyticus]|uniref:hypothetical protein n=1 Tax=Halovivax gelatinilyticus TaxID=2961597 RepID=UPI0020CA81C8|nr:hypothetical protein [Halovivax gelatinilyticus]
MLEETELERDVVQLAVREAISLALETPLGEPIREAVAADEPQVAEAPSADEAVDVESTPAEPATETTGDRSTVRTIGVLAAVAIGLYVAIRWLGDDGN